MKLDVSPPGELGKNPEKDWSSVADFMNQCAFIINGNLDPATNLKCEVHRVQFATTNMETDVRHKLGRLAIGYFIIRKSGNFNIYDGSNVFNQSSIFLRASAPGSATVLVF